MNAILRPDSRHVAQAVLDELEPPIRRALRAHHALDAKDELLGLLRERIEKVLWRELEAPRPPAVQAGQAADEALPVHDLRPEQVVAEGWVSLSLSQLYRADEDGRFYSIRPAGRRNGRLFPAWQFAPAVLPVLPGILALLAKRDPSRMHIALVGAEDELNELSPAEMLAGLPFASRTDLEPSQRRLLDLPETDRVNRVREVLTALPRQEAVG